MARETFPLAPAIQKLDRLLVISPHCDDETLGAGGTIAAARKTGAAVQVIFLTNGDGSGSTRIVQQAQDLEKGVKSLASPGTWRGLVRGQGAGGVKSTGSKKNLFQRIAARRQQEALAACLALGVKADDVLFLGYPDGGTRAMWEQNWSNTRPYYSTYTKTSQSPYANSYTPGAPYSGRQLTADLEKIILEFRPTTILTTHPEDTHADHWAAYAYTCAAMESFRHSSHRNMRALAAQMQLRTFLVHHGIWPAPHGYHPNAELAPPASLEKCGTRWEVEPISVRHRSAKKAALDCYVSQLVFTPLYLRSFIRKNELYGVVPVHSGTLGVKTPGDVKTLLLKDGPSDSIWRERWPAADIRSLQLATTGDALLLHSDLGRKPSARLRYHFILHVIDESGMHAFEVKAQAKNRQLQAILTNLDAEDTSVTLTGNVTANGLEVNLPLSALQLDADIPCTLLVSANTQSGRTRLDQTATATLRLESRRGKGS